jgi:sugar O-acyltransferase (sialic acid O-acetyltransferase NeuD family)
LVDIAGEVNKRAPKWEAVYFVDDVRKAASHYGIKVLRLPDLERWPKPFECVIAIGEPQHRLAMYETLMKRGIRLATVIDPSARVSPTATIEPGCIIGPGSFVSSHTRLDENVMLEINTIVGHDIYVGKHSVISSCTVLGGATKVGARAFIGLNCTVKENLSIGDGAIVGMHSAVFHDVPGDVIALGNPCRVIKRNESKRVFE